MVISNNNVFQERPTGGAPPVIHEEQAREIEYAQQVNPQIRIFQVSALTGAGLENWYNWLSQSQQEAPYVEGQ